MLIQTNNNSGQGSHLRNGCGGFCMATIEQPSPGFYIMEEWKDIEGYEGLYQISNKGRVRSMDRTINVNYATGNNGKRFYKGRLMKIIIKKNGYCQITLAKNVIHKRPLVHILVGMAFVPNPYNKPEINHKDGDKGNNNFTNLEWVTSSENQIHANNVLFAQVGENNPHSKFKNSQVIEIIDLYDLLKNYALIARMYNVDPSTIRRMVTRKTYRYA